MKKVHCDICDEVPASNYDARYLSLTITHSEGSREQSILTRITTERGSSDENLDVCSSCRKKLLQQFVALLGD